MTWAGVAAPQLQRVLDAFEQPSLQEFALLTEEDVAETLKSWDAGSHGIMGPVLQARIRTALHAAKVLLGLQLHYYCHRQQIHFFFSNTFENREQLHQL